jgi:L-ribulose-5-phosphate 4-epimerase
MYEIEKRAIIDAALALKEYNLIALSGGNVSLRLDNGHILVTPSGMSYKGMVEDDIIVMTLSAEVVE